MLATVKGDVHDIGKNLVDIILTNNGYRVVNLGIKQPLANILEAAKRSIRPTPSACRACSVKSTVVMRENLEEMTRRGVDVPVLLGGAALTRRYVEEDCAAAYASGRVAYARDAFDGLAPHGQGGERHVSTRISPTSRSASAAARAVNAKRKLGRAADAAPAAPGRCRGDPPAPRRADARPRGAGAALLGPAHHRARAGQGAACPISTSACSINSIGASARTGAALDEFKAWARARAAARSCTRMLDIAIQQDILQPQAAYGYWPCAAEGNDVILFDADGATRARALRLPAPEQARAASCIADFFRDVERRPSATSSGSRS